MTDSFNHVRTVHRHLRRAGELLAQQQFDAASSEVDAALSYDPGSLAAQAMRERILHARSTRALSASAARRRLTDSPEVGHTPTISQDRFIPAGVDAKSWIGFEHRVQERRFQGLLETIRTAIAERDGVAARVAFEEARELRPNSPELAEIDDVVMALPLVMPPSPHADPDWLRAAGAVAMLVTGMALLVTIDWMRPDTANAPLVATSSPTTDDRETASPARAAAQDVSTTPVVVSAAPAGAGGTVGTTGGSRYAPESESTSAATTPAGGAPSASDFTFERMDADVRPSPARSDAAPALIAEARPPLASPRVDVGLSRASLTPSATRVPPGGEVPDDYVFVAPRTRAMSGSTPRPVSPPPEPGRVTPSSPRVTGGAGAPVANVARQPGSVTQPIAVAPTTEPVAARVDDPNVAQLVLNRYARAYSRLDAGAVHDIWPSVDERALARAFSSLSSQNVAFDSCDIQVNGTNATAACKGRATYVGKVGSRVPRVEPREWRFQLRREDDEWKIASAEARRPN